MTLTKGVCISIWYHPESVMVCLIMWDDLVKKGVYQVWYHPDSVMVCLRIWDDLVGRVCIRIWYHPGRAPVTQETAIFRYLEAQTLADFEI